MKKVRPKIKLELQPVDVILEAVAVTGLLAMIGLTIYQFGNLPERIPIHFNAKGEPDGFGNKLSIWLLPAIGLVIYVLLTVLNKYPHTFNYLTEITVANANRQYTIATRMIRTLKALILAFFSYIVYEMIMTATGKSEGLGAQFMILFLAMILGAVGYFLVKSMKK